MISLLLCLLLLLKWQVSQVSPLIATVVSELCPFFRTWTVFVRFGCLPWVLLPVIHISQRKIAEFCLLVGWTHTFSQQFISVNSTFINGRGFTQAKFTSCFYVLWPTFSQVNSYFLSPFLGVWIQRLIWAFALSGIFRIFSKLGPLNIKKHLKNRGTQHSDKSLNLDMFPNIEELGIGRWSLSQVAASKRQRDWRGLSAATQIKGLAILIHAWLNLLNPLTTTPSHFWKVYLNSFTMLL